MFIINQADKIWESLPRVVEVTSDGTVTYHQRYVGLVSQPLELSDFPMDKHLFAIQFITAGYLADELEFVPMTLGEEQKITGGAIAEQLSVPDWRVMDFAAIPRSFEAIKGRQIAGFAIEFIGKRYFNYYFWQVIMPLSLIVMMSCTVFWIDPTNASTQIGVATSSILTLIAYRFVLAGLLPRLPYMTRMDYFTLGCTLLVFLVLVEVIASSALAGNKHVETARRLDNYSKFSFPFFFIVMFVWFISGV